MNFSMSLGARWEQPAQAQGVTLLFREGGSLVDLRIMQQVDPPFPVHVQMKVETVCHEVPPGTCGISMSFRVNFLTTSTRACQPRPSSKTPRSYRAVSYTHLRAH